MIETVKNISIREFTGECRPFDGEELQTHLANCFNAAGLAEENYVAEDISIAVEHALNQRAPSDGVFARGELDAAVVRMLEEIGYPEVARHYRKTGGERQLLVECSELSLAEFLRNFLACDAGQLPQVVAKVAEAAKKLAIDSASPQFILELGRHYRQDTPAAQRPEVHSSDIGRDEVAALLPRAAAKLYGAGVLQVNGVSGALPSLRMFLNLKALAATLPMPHPVTEMNFEPLLADAACAIRRSFEVLQQHYAPDGGRLPCFLVLDGVAEFISEDCGGVWSPDCRLAGEFTDCIEAAFPPGYCRISIR